MGGYTRVLQGEMHDWLSKVMPTVVVKNLPEELRKDYAPMVRSYTLLLWSLSSHFKQVKEDYIFMTEPDHILLGSPPNWATPRSIPSFHFNYMHPTREHFGHLQRHPVGFEDFGLTGNSPAIMHKIMLQKICPLWLLYNLKMQVDVISHEKLGWVREMGAYILAAAQILPHPAKITYHQDFMC